MNAPVSDPLRQRLVRHLAVIDADVEPVTARYAKHIQCRRGCSDCCRQSFEVSDLEGAYLREGFLALGPQTRAEILERAAAYRPRTGSPCPALTAEGACSIYAHRPRICRKYGIPLWNPQRPEQVDTCPKNFRGVADVDPELLVEPQARWAAAWIKIRGATPMATHTATIAAHLLRASGAGTPATSVNANE